MCYTNHLLNQVQVLSGNKRVVIKIDMKPVAAKGFKIQQMNPKDVSTPIHSILQDDFRPLVTKYLQVKRKNVNVSDINIVLVLHFCKVNEISITSLT